MVKLFIKMISNKKIKKLSILSTKKGRKEEGKFLIEGYRIIRSALRNNVNIENIYISNRFKASEDYKNLNGLISENIDVAVLDEKTINKICQTVNPAGIVAACLLPDDFKITKLLTDNWIYLDKISDPGNIGTLLRTSAWFGINNVALSSKCADAFNPKVVRSAMGAHFSLNIVGNMDLFEFKKNQYCIIGADQNGSPMDDFNYDKKKWILVIGNEGHGISENSKKYIQHFLSIPSSGSGNSLNAAVAGSILIHHLISL